MPALLDIIKKKPAIRSLTPDRKLLDVLEVMMTDNVHHVVLVEKDSEREINGVKSPGILAGIISDRDMRLALNVPIFNVEEVSFTQALKDFVEQLEDHTAKEVMSTQLITTNVDANLQDVIRSMKTADINAIPIVDKESNHFIGLLTRGDLIDLLTEILEKE
jgi:CBS domain-containing protein